MTVDGLEPIFVGTEDEVASARKVLTQCLPHLRLTVRPSGEFHEILAVGEDIDYVRPTLNRLLRRVRPLRQRIAEEEEQLASLLDEMLRSRSFVADHVAKTPLYRRA